MLLLCPVIRTYLTCGISLRHEKNNLLLHKMSDVLYLKKCGTLPFSHQKVTWNSFDKWRKLPKLQAIFGLAKNKSNQRDGYVYVSCKCLPLPTVVVSLNLNRNFTLDLTHSAKNLQPLTFFCTLLRRVFFFQQRKLMWPSRTEWHFICERQQWCFLKFYLK